MSTLGTNKDNEPIQLTCGQQIKHTTTSHELYILRGVANKNTVKVGTKKPLHFCEGCHPKPLLQVPTKKINSNHVRVVEFWRQRSPVAFSTCHANVILVEAWTGILEIIIPNDRLKKVFGEAVRVG